MRRFSWYLGAVLFSVALGALVARGTLGLWPLFAVAALLGLVGLAVDTTTVRRWTGRPARGTRFNVVYDEIIKIREELRNAPAAGVGFDRPQWNRRILAVDRAFWDLVLGHYAGQERTLRSSLIDLPGLLERDLGDEQQWIETMRRELLARKVTMDSLSQAAP